MKQLIWIGFIAYVLNGLAHVIIGSLLPELLLHYDITYSKGGQLIFAQFSGFLIGVLLVPWMSAKFSKRRLVLFLLLLLGFAQLIYGFLPPWQWMYVIGFWAGFSFGAVEALIGTLIIERIKVRTAVAMSQLEVGFGVGALLMPVIASILIANGYWQLSFFALSLCSFIVALAWFFLPLSDIENTTNGPLHAASASYSKKELYILGIAILFFLIYVGIEMGFVNFMSSILIIKFKLSIAASSFSVTCFWLAMVIGRLFTGVIAEKINYAVFLLWSTLGSVISFILFSLTYRSWAAFAMILFLGLFMSGIFSIALLLANKLLYAKTVQTTSLLIAAGGIGGALIPLAIGWSMDHLTVQLVIYYLTGNALLLFIISFLAWQYQFKHRNLS